VLTLLWKDEEEWWTVRNAHGSCGLVPVKYLDKVKKPSLFLPDGGVKLQIAVSIEKCCILPSVSCTPSVSKYQSAAGITVM